MNLANLQKAITKKVILTAQQTFGVELEQIAAEVPPKTDLGDLAFPVAFELAKLIKQQTGEKQNPRAIAESFKSAIEELDFVEDIQIAGPGYLNIFYERTNFFVKNGDSEPFPNLNF